MKKVIAILLITILVFSAAFAGCKSGDSSNAVEHVQADATPQNAEPTAKPTATATTQESTLQRGEPVYIDGIDLEEISTFLRGNVFQAHTSGIASGNGELIYFTPEGNEYYWFCSSMDQQSRLRAEYGTWEIDGGFMTLTTLMLREWVGGHFATAYGSTASRFELEDYDVVLTEVNIESFSNFRMFRFLPSEPQYTEEDLGFRCIGTDFFHVPYLDDEIPGYLEYFQN